MDILKDFKWFFYEGGLDSLIQTFRNPSLMDKLELDANYIPESDSREYYDSRREEFGEPCRWVVPFSNWLAKHLTDYKKELVNRCENLREIQASDAEFVKTTFESSDLDFRKLRNDIINNESLKSYHEQLILSITEVEGVYKKRKRELLDKKVLVVSNKADRISISFEFIGKEELLKALYYDLKFDSGDFVDSNKTSFQQFKEVLTSDNVKEVEGEIWFACETRQACYVIEKLVPYFQNLKYQLIEESGKFHTRKNLLSAGNISRSLVGKEPKQKDYVDAFFKQFQNRK
jgi:hypothetical protein